MFKVGDIVFHRSFGRGEVVGIADDSYVIKFDKLETNRNILKDSDAIRPYEADKTEGR